MDPNTPELTTYRLDGLDVQSYWDESTTRKLYEFIRAKGIMGRTAPPRRGFVGMDKKLLWKKRFTYGGKRYVVQGGGPSIGIFDDIAPRDQASARKAYRRCVICNMNHPESDLVDSLKGAMCRPCFEVANPPCEQCGEPTALPDGAEPDDGPFWCDRCLEQRK